MTRYGPDVIAIRDAATGFLKVFTGSAPVYSDETGGTQLTDMTTTSGVPTSTVTADSDTGRIEFDRPGNGLPSVWVEIAAGVRWQIDPNDLDSRAGGVASVSLNGGTPQTGAVAISALTSVASTNISDASTSGKAVLTGSAAAGRTALGSTSTGDAVFTAPSQTAARTAIGAGTSNLAIGTTSTTAKAGNYAPDLTGYATIAGTTRQFSDVSNTAPNGGYIEVFDAISGKWIPTDPNAQFAGIDAAGRLLPQNRPKYDLDLVVINQGDSVPADAAAGALVWQRPTTASLIPILEGSNFSGTNNTTLTFTNSDAYAVGDWIGFGVMTSGETTSGTLPTVISSITPASGAYSSIVSGPESVQSGTVQVDLKYAKCSTAIPAGTTHTMTLNQNRVHKAVVMFKMPALTPTAPLDQSTNNQGGALTTLDLSVGPTGNMALTPEIGILVTGHNDGTAPVTRVVSGTNGWTLLSSVESDNGGSSRSLNVLYKTYANASPTPLQGTVHVTASDGSTGAWAMTVASFKGA